MNRNIEKINFVTYLRRPYDLLTIEVHAKAYEKELKKMTGFEFSKIGYLSNGKIVNILMIEKELNDFLERLEFLVINFPKKIENILNRGEKYNREMNKILKSKEKFCKSLKYITDRELSQKFKKMFLLFSNQFVCTTSIPYRLGIVLYSNNLLKKNKKFINQVKKLRKVSLYDTFKEEIIGCILKEIANRCKINDYKKLFGFRSNEIIDFLEKKMSFSEFLYQKRNYFCYFLIDKNDIFFTGKKDYQYYKNIFCNLTADKKVVGQRAYPGKVKGVAKVFLNYENSKDFKKGEIMVSVNSNPKLMSIIKKAGAIVTDEGGITCHASIISRELKIPCVVGTKNATEVLKDGDIVEVDANTGIVTKI